MFFASRHTTSFQRLYDVYTTSATSYMMGTLAVKTSVICQGIKESYIIMGPKLKVALLGLRQFLATENPLKIMKNAFNFTSKALFVLKILKFLS